MKNGRKKYPTAYECRLNEVLDDIYAGHETYKQLHQSSGLCYSTVRKIGNREVRRPQFRSVLLLAQATGYDLTLVKQR